MTFLYALDFEGVLPDRIWAQKWHGGMNDLEGLSFNGKMNLMVYKTSLG